MHDTTIIQHQKTTLCDINSEVSGRRRQLSLLLLTRLGCFQMKLSCFPVGHCHVPWFGYEMLLILLISAKEI